ncbi:hypothetical protein M0722_16380 [Microbacterium sp. KSW4-16]|uniref:hypothetical protein n=1 Tax=Microbacterium aurugineum TaxID=2851642 RepID=UPI0020BD5FE2|nr:hypothetical protein [Microbacterium aurugineum]MCK8468772.1 hypothetical protein [Microbacterium aurugineum]
MTADTDALRARVEELENQNAALLAQTAGRTRPKGARWRPFTSAVLIVVAAVLVPASIVGAWARVQLVDENAFVATLAPLIDEPSVQQLLVDETMTAFRAQVDLPAVVDTVIDGVTELTPGDRTGPLLDVLRAPLADGLDGVIASTVTTAIASDTFASAWETSLRGAHRALTIASTSDGAGIVRITPDGLGIALGPLVAEVKDALVARGVGLATLIPGIDRVVIVGSADSLIAVRAGYAAADLIGWWLPVGTLVAFGLGIAVARRRSTAVLGVGAAITLGSASLTATLWLGGIAAEAASTALDISPTVIAVIAAQLFADMRATAAALTVLGVVIAVAGWLAGRSRAASRVRAAVGGFDAAVRHRLAARGVRFGGFGTWLAAHRTAVRLALVAMVVVVLLAMMPLRVGGLVVVLLVALVVAWLLELVPVHPDDGPAGAPRDEEVPA